MAFFINLPISKFLHDAAYFAVSYLRSFMFT